MTKSASELFGETYEGLEVHEFPVHSGGTGYYVQWDDNNPRATYPRTELIIEWPDGEQVRQDIESEQELKLWTEHLG
jgi:hypothetical protein